MSDKLKAPFEREERYIVIKRKHLDEITECAIRTGLNGYRVNTVECVVVESDWPEYETVWRMIEDRVTGRDGGHRAAMVRAFEASGWSSLLAEKQADIALSVLRTPTPEQAGEVERLIVALEKLSTKQDGYGMMFESKSHIRRGGAELRLFGDRADAAYWLLNHGKEIVAALQSTPPAQPTADAVERLRVAMVGAARARGGAGAKFIADGHTNLWLDIAFDALATLQPTMAGDYVMVPREALTDQISHIETRIQDGRELGATVWRLALEDIVREHRALIAASPTGGE